jgi:hypothetical protein
MIQNLKQRVIYIDHNKILKSSKLDNIYLLNIIILKLNINFFLKIKIFKLFNK